MKFSLSWLKEYLETGASPKEIAERLTALGLEVESLADRAKDLEPFVIAEILHAEKHPNADRLRVCKVSDGNAELQIVCGAPNARAGIKVVLAPVGALIPNGGFKIKQSKIRDVASQGMLCSAAELMLGEDGEGIIELAADAPVGGKFVKYRGLDDPVFEIAITPNRADCLGVAGVARDLAASGIGKLKKRETRKIPGAFASPLGVRLESESCPYYLGRYIKGIKNGKSPEWLEKKLLAIGQKPISALVDLTNFLTFDQGRPAHVYDADKISGFLSVRKAKGGEKIAALNNKEYTLEGETVIADEKGPVAIAGIIGDTATGCGADTKNVFLEIAYFAPEAVARDGRKLQINSDARYRFERGVDPEAMSEMMEFLTEQIIALCGGEASEVITAGKKPETARKVKFDPASVEKLGGMKLPSGEAEKILQELGFGVSGGEVSVPSWRADVDSWPDLVEEVMRVKGYDNIPAIPLPPASTGKAEGKSQERSIRAVLAARGMREAVSYSFMASAVAADFGGGSQELQLLNPIAENLNEMRPSLIPNLLEAVAGNANRGFFDLALFEIGPEFGVAGEKTVAAGIRSGKAVPRNVHGGERDADMFDAKGDILAIAGRDVKCEPGAPSWYHPGRSAKILENGVTLGYFGELHPSILKKLGIQRKAAGFEFFLRGKAAVKKAALKLSEYQQVERDFAFVVDKNARAGDLAEAAKEAGDLISNAEIFDVFEGGSLPEGKKSVALSITLTPYAKTLEESEIEGVSAKVAEIMKNRFNAIIRG